MNTKNSLKEENRKESLVNRFAMIIGTSIFLTLFFIAAYNLYTSIPIFKQYRIEKNISRSAISNVVFENFRKDIRKNINNPDYPNLSAITKSLINNNLVLYVNVISKKTNKYTWSSIPGIRGLPGADAISWSNPVFAKKYSNLDFDEIQEFHENYGNYMITIGFLSDDILISLINVLIKGDLILILIFIVFGFASAFSLAKFVTKPINNLVAGAEEFSKGNLKYRANVATYDEIGMLAKAFNAMAEKLDILYTSLEQQVKDRTAELVSKNVELEKANKEIKDAQTMLIHSEKMKSLGQLVAGVAHELNNPINFIYGNLDHLKNYTNNLIEIIETYENIAGKLSEQELEQVKKIKTDVEYEYLLEDIPALLKSCKDGTERCKQIVLDLKNFSRLDEAVIKEVDIHEGIDSTLNILHNKSKHKVTIHKEYGNLPRLSCYAGQLNQVFMNILDNAIQAIPEHGDIYIKTDLIDNKISIIIEDNGAGIDQEVLSKVFDPFFTTKPVGEGTGLGLSISYKIIKTHNGTIDVTSEKGKGTKFTIKIPIDWHKPAKKVKVVEA